MNAREIIENIDSFEGGTDYDLVFQTQIPVPPRWHHGHRSSRMLLRRNQRRQGFGCTDRDSMRDRGWPWANRGFDAQMKKYKRALARFGQVRGGEGI